MEGTEIVKFEQKSRQDKSAAGTEPHRWSQHASGHCRDNHFNKTLVQPSRNIALILGSGMQRLLIKDQIKMVTVIGYPTLKCFIYNFLLHFKPTSKLLRQFYLLVAFQSQNFLKRRQIHCICGLGIQAPQTCVAQRTSASGIELFSTL